jgi:transcription termination factor Rho
VAAEREFTGVLEIDPKRFGFVRPRSLTMAQSPGDVFIPPALIARHHLREGVEIAGTAADESGKKGQVKNIATVNGLSPEAWERIPDFSQLEVVSPDAHLRLEGPGSDRAMRVVDLFCPVGKGTRGLIVSPPKAGKTMLLQQLAHAISTQNPDVDLAVLLIDERPEEVTDMRRTIRGTVYASSSDLDRGSHVRLAQLVLEEAKRRVETGRHVVLLLDSLTRMGRAFNAHQRSSGRTLSGGVDIRALEIPKRIFGAARNIEHGGSLTILATALVETGSRMDELIFEEFKGTGNMELVLDRDLASERVFPAINLRLSGTRREELLFGEAVRAHQELRRSVARLAPRDAIRTVLELLERYPTNSALLARFA